VQPVRERVDDIVTSNNAEMAKMKQQLNEQQKQLEMLLQRTSSERPASYRDTAMQTADNTASVEVQTEPAAPSRRHNAQKGPSNAASSSRYDSSTAASQARSAQ